jgi:hypothetical protein
MLVHQGPALGGSDQHFVRPGCAVQVTVLAGSIDVERMMRVFDRRDAQAALRRQAHQSGDQVRLARVLATHDAEDFHAAPPLEQSHIVPIRALARRTATAPLENVS